MGKMKRKKATYDLPLGRLLLGELVAAKLLEQLSGQSGGETIGVQVVDRGVVLVRFDVERIRLGLGKDAVQTRGRALPAAQRALGADRHGDGGLVHLAHGAVGRRGEKGEGWEK